jgi:hypothetical protein
MLGAEHAVCVLDVYGEGGSWPAKEVIDKVRYWSAEGEDTPGSVVLLKWPTKWEEKHKKFCDLCVIITCNGPFVFLWLFCIFSSCNCNILTCVDDVSKL